MAALGLFLGVVGVCDLVRAARDATSWPRRSLATGLGVALLGLGCGLLDRDGAGWVVVWLLASLGLAGWVLGSAHALAARSRAGRVVAVAGLLVGLAVVAGDSDELERDDWPHRLADTLIGQQSMPLTALVVGVLLVQLSTANVAVRMLLDAVGVPAGDNEKQLRGGRVLGPLERVLLVVLGLGGALVAAVLVATAKGLLRFPELQRGERSGPSDVTEYFLIGSFASWLVALAGLAAVWLGAPAG